MSTTATMRAQLRPRALLVAEELEFRQMDRDDNGRWLRLDREDRAARVAKIEADHREGTGREIGRKVAEAMAYYDRVLDDQKAQRESMERWRKRVAEFHREGQDDGQPAQADRGLP